MLTPSMTILAESVMLGQPAAPSGPVVVPGGAADMIPAFVAVLAVLSLLPFLLTMLTSFAKLVVVGGIVRQAVGTPQIPPTIVVTGLALILTIHIMAPVAITMYADFESSSVIARAAAAQPQVAEARWAAVAASMREPARPTDRHDPASIAAITSVEILLSDPSRGARLARRQLAADSEIERLGAPIPGAAGSSPADRAAFASLATDANLRSLRVSVEGPIEEFLVRHASRRNVELFEGLITRLMKSQSVEASEMPATLKKFVTLAPAFVLTELSEAFMIGFLIFVPFLVVDLVVSNILLALGMQMLTPTMISLPLKLLVFVMMDGWGLILRGLVSGYA